MTGPSDPSGQAPPPLEPPAAPSPGAAPPPAGEAGQASGQWAQQGQTPDWAQKAQDWRPAEVASGPAAGIVYADVTTRIVAYIIDLVILVIVGFVVNLVLITAFLATLFTSGSAIFLLASVAVLVINVFIAAIYFIYTWTTMKASPGQRILGLMCVSETDGSALTTNAAIARYVIMFAPSYIASLASTVVPGILGLLLSLAGIAWTVFLIYTTASDTKRQGFHDHYAHSVVIKPTAPAA
jgi:uncharacterized RDD family membrane protein YckC